MSKKKSKRPSKSELQQTHIHQALAIIDGMLQGRLQYGNQNPLIDFDPSAPDGRIILASRSPLIMLRGEPRWLDLEIEGPPQIYLISLRDAESLCHELIHALDASSFRFPILFFLDDEFFLVEHFHQRDDG